MTDKNLTHKDLADVLGISETTVKSYRRKFPGCIPVASEGKPIRFTENALEVATRIRDYFSTGMSVKEVRVRLSQEFSWISQKNDSEKQEPIPKNTTPDISQGFSNMAKSMVSMAQQQKVLVKRMQFIEGQLEELGLKKDEIGSNKGNNGLENRLDHLDSVTESLAETVTTLAEKLDRFLGDRAKIADDWRQKKISSDRESQARSHVVSFSPNQKAESSNQGVFSSDTSNQKNSLEPNEPPRHFYTFPLVVRTAEGKYVSAAGRGRFSINDFKALLVYGFEPPHHYTMQFESHGSGWWLLLEQPQNPNGHTLHLLLMELPTQKNGNVIEILQVKNNGETVHPAEICAIISEFSQ